MVTVTEQFIKNIPTLFVEKKSNQYQSLPTVLYFHGFTSAKEHNLPLAYLLAKEDYRVILPDSKYHGARAKATSETERQLAFWDIVLTSVSETKTIKQYLEAHQLLFNGRIGVAGTSMGGITTAALLATYEWISVAAILMGSPKITSFARLLLEQFPDQSKLPTEKEIAELMKTISTYDLTKHLGKLNNRPLLLWHGMADKVVPFDHTASFYELAKEVYTKEQHLRLIKAKNQGHKVSRPAILETVRWFSTYL